MYLDGKTVPMDKRLTEAFNTAYLTLGGMGERVLGINGIHRSKKHVRVY